MDTQFWLILLSAILPAVVLVAYVLIKDRKRPEPFKLIAKGFGYGCVSVGVAILLVMGTHLLGFNIDEHSFWGAIADAFFNAAFPEEAAKMLMLWLLVRKNPFFNEHLDGIVYAACIGMGFAATENIMYLFSNFETWQSVAIGRAFFSIPGHFCFAVMMGYFFAIAFFNPKKQWYFILAYLVPVVMHGVYDACLEVNTIAVNTSAIIIFLVCFIFAIKQSRKAIKKHQTTDDSVLATPVEDDPVSSVSIDSEARALYDELKANENEYSVKNRAEGMQIFELSWNRYWKPFYLVDNNSHCAYQWLDENECLLTVTENDIDWDSLEGLPQNVIDRAHRLSFHFPGFIHSYQDGRAKVDWQINPDGRYYMDSDGYGMTDDEEINLHGYIDRQGKVVEKFTYRDN
ncbi:MAG: PrsW family glutamic-type intramembrane protease [Paludibacteraceae bacterium]|nr:PrsW family glutamic-type intramembrane protease [Paludibacteraceae bacterium]